MSRPAPDLTLQVNLCPGDVDYCETLVPALVAAHRKSIAEAIGIVDCCRPPSTAWVDMGQRIPAAGYEARVDKIVAQSEALVATGILDRLVMIRPGDAEIPDLARKYFGVATSLTHDHLAHAFASYFAGLEAPRTRYVVHYDSDVMLRQPTGRDWAAEACVLMANDPSLLAVSPRICPPLDDPSGMINPGPFSSWSDHWELTPTNFGWRSDWISTRAFCLDRDRLTPILPLVPSHELGQAHHGILINEFLSGVFASEWWHRTCATDSFIGRLLRGIRNRVLPGAPPAPEVLFQEMLRRTGLKSAYLGDVDMWIAHPDTKPAAFLAILDPLLAAVTNGDFPPEQRGCGSLRLEAWTAFVNR